jgi:glutaredoxin
MCGWCIDAKEWLDAQGLPYETRNTGTDLAARQRAIDLSGQTLVPVIEVDDHVLGDFDTDQLQAFLKKHGYLPA